MYSLIKRLGIYTSIGPDISLISGDNYDEKLGFINLFYDMFGYHLQDVYENNNYDNDTNNQVLEIFNNMKNYCIEYFTKTKFFSKETCLEAIKKLNYLDIVIGRTQYYIDLNNLSKLDNDFYNNVLEISYFYYKETIKNIGKRVDRKYISVNSDLYSYMLNAYYDPRSNMIYIPTSIMSKIFFDKNAEAIYNYGGIGSIIGHELMHSFDNIGSQYDELGHIRNWWTDNDYNKYEYEVNKVRKHYSRISINGMQINPNISISENLLILVV